MFTRDTFHAGSPADIKFITRQKNKAAKNDRAALAELPASQIMEPKSAGTYDPYNAVPPNEKPADMPINKLTSSGTSENTSATTKMKKPRL